MSIIIGRNTIKIFGIRRYLDANLRAKLQRPKPMNELNEAAVSIGILLQKMSKDSENDYPRSLLEKALLGVSMALEAPPPTPVGKNVAMEERYLFLQNELLQAKINVEKEKEKAWKERVTQAEKDAKHALFVTRSETHEMKKALAKDEERLDAIKEECVALQEQRNALRLEVVKLEERGRAAQNLLKKLEADVSQKRSVVKTAPLRERKKEETDAPLTSKISELVEEKRV